MKRKTIVLISIPMLLILSAIVFTLLGFVFNRRVNDSALKTKVETIELYNRIENRTLIMYNYFKDYIITKEKNLYLEYEKIYNQLMKDLDDYEEGSVHHDFINIISLRDILIQKNEIIKNIVNIIENGQESIVIEHYKSKVGFLEEIIELIDEADKKIYSYYDQVIDDNKKYDRIFSLLIFNLVAILIIYSILIIIWFLKMNNKIILKNQEIESKNKELERVNLLKDKFFGVIAHDLRGPFSGILGFINLLEDEILSCKEDSSCKYYIVSIRESGKNYYNFLESLLMWAKAQMNQFELKIQKINLFTIIYEINEIYKSMLKNKGIIFENNCPKEFVIESDYNILHTVIRNIINNCVKYTKEGGKVTVYVDSQRNMIIIKDTGIGMSPELIKKLFSMEKLQSKEGTAGEKGSGLGLMICMELLKNIGFGLEIKSELGVGSEFIIKLK